MSKSISANVKMLLVAPLTALDPCTRSAGDNDRAKMKELRMLSQQAEDAFACLERGTKLLMVQGKEDKE